MYDEKEEILKNILNKLELTKTTDSNVINYLQKRFKFKEDKLKDIYTKAGGWKNIILKPTPIKKATKGQRYDIPGLYEVINKKNPSEKVEVTENEFSLLGTINKMIPTSQANDMKIIRVGEDKELSGKTIEDKYPVKKTEPAGNAAPAPTSAPQEPTMFDAQIKSEEAANVSNALNAKIQKLQQEIFIYDAEISSLQAPTSMIRAAIPAKKKQELLIKFKEQRAIRQKELDSLRPSR
jgi:hypothetical protein